MPPSREDPVVREARISQLAPVQHAEEELANSLQKVDECLIETPHIIMLMSMLRPGCRALTTAIDVLHCLDIDQIKAADAEVCSTEQWLIAMANVIEIGAHSESAMLALSMYSKWLKADSTIKEQYYDVHDKVIGMALKMIKFKNSRVREHAASCLVTLCVGTVKNKEALQSNCGIPFVLPLLCDASTTASASKLLWMIARLGEAQQDEIFLELPEYDKLVIKSRTKMEDLLVMLLPSARKVIGDEDQNKELKAIKFITNMVKFKKANISQEELTRVRERLDSINRRQALGLTSMPQPDEFCCPITCVKMVDPVVASDGYTYEREAIERILKGPPVQRVSPMTRSALEHRVFVNINLRKRIAEFENDVLQAVETSQAAQVPSESPAVPTLKRKRYT